MASLVWEYESLDVPAARVPLRVPNHWFFTFTAFLRPFRRNSPALCLLSIHLDMIWPNIVFLRPGIPIKSTLDTIIGWKTVVYRAVRAGSSWFSFTSSFDSLATSFSCTWCSYSLKDVVWWPQHITLFLGSYRWETSGDQVWTAQDAWWKVEDWTVKFSYHRFLKISLGFRSIIYSNLFFLQKNAKKHFSKRILCKKF